MIKEMKVIVKCPVTNKDVVFKLEQYENNYDWFLTDTRLANGSSVIFGDVGEAIKNILTLSAKN